MPAKKIKILGMIPARYASTRFPGKMLAPIAGKSLIQRTYENAKQSPLFHELFVATDDVRIYDHVINFGGKAVMTSESCPTGSDRLVDALKKHPNLNQSDIVINVQGDEPCVHLDVIEKIAKLLIAD